MSPATSHYLLHAYGCISPELYGPYDSADTRDAKVLEELKHCDPSEQFMVGLAIIDGRLEIEYTYDLEEIVYGADDEDEDLTGGAA